MSAKLHALSRLTYTASSCNADRADALLISPSNCLLSVQLMMLYNLQEDEGADTEASLEAFLAEQRKLTPFLRLVLVVMHEGSKVRLTMLIFARLGQTSIPTYIIHAREQSNTYNVCLSTVITKGRSHQF